MRIAFVSHELPPETGGGGIGTYLGQIAPALAASGHSVELFAGGAADSRQQVAENLVVHRTACAGSPEFAEAVAGPFAAVHLREPFDVVEGCDFDASAVAIKRRFPDLPYVCKLHTPRFAVDEMHHRRPGPMARLRMTLGALRRGRRPPEFAATGLRRTPGARRELEAMSRADVLAAPSEAIAASARAWVPGCGDRIQVFPYPYAPAPALLALPPGGPGGMVTFLGRIEPRKGVEDLARAIKRILARQPAARFQFVGREMPAPDKTGSMIAALRRILGPTAAAAVQFPGPCQPSELAEVFRRSDLIVIPSHWESFGLVCCEALAAARAVVATSGSGLAEILAQGACGVLVPPRSPDALAAAIERLLADPAERVRLGTLGRARVLRAYAVAAVVPAQLASYERAIRRAHSRRPGASP
jgi:glycogen(starch) synthase